MFEASVLYLANYEATEHIVVNQGGTSSGKTYSIIQVLFVLAASDEKQVVTIVGQDIPNLKAGALRDAISIYDSSSALKSLIRSYNKSDRIFELNNGSILEFKSYDNAQDAKSGKRDYLFINEANGINFQIYTELALRTKKRIFIDYNPNAEFWVHEHLIGKPGVKFIRSWHEHNPFLSDLVRQKIEALKDIDEETWKVYARGITGKIEGIILRNWVLVDDIPETAKFIGYGLDFGFTNDETGLIEVYKQDGELWINELIYETGLTNNDISDKFYKLGVGKHREIIADSAEPKSIEELERLGWFVTGAKKGADSVTNSIDILKRYKMNITRNSLNLRMELGRYIWKVDKLGKSLNQPIDQYNHLIDPLRYIALNKLRIDNIGPTKSKLPYIGHNNYTNEMDFMR
jgi:phage terminase large subunit